MRLSFGVLVLVVGCVSAVLAGPFDAGVHVGYPMGGDVEDGSLLYGVQARYSFAPNWAVTLDLSTFSDEVEETETWDAGAGGAVWTRDADIAPLALSLVFSDEAMASLRWYVGGGAALYILDVSASARPLAGAQTSAVSIELDMGTGYGVQGFGGVEYALMERVSLSGEFRYSYAGFPYEAVYAGVDGGDAWRMAEDDTDSYSWGLLRVAAAYRF